MFAVSSVIFLKVPFDRLSFRFYRINFQFTPLSTFEQLYFPTIYSVQYAVGGSNLDQKFQRRNLFFYRKRASIIRG